MSLTYSSYVTSLANLFPVASSDPGYQTVLPNIIDDAEQRCYRELQLQNTVVTDTSTFATGQRVFNLPTTVGTFLVVDRINVITPVGSITSNSVRNSLVPMEPGCLDMLWPSSTGSTVPQYFGMVTQTTIIVGPWPDQTYTVEVTGTQRPVALSSTNVTTLLSWYFPDLFLAASMVFGAAYMKNYGASSDNPQQAQSWESHYQNLMQSAQTEEMRKRFNMAGWSSKPPAPQATPPRT